MLRTFRLALSNNQGDIQALTIPLSPAILLSRPSSSWTELQILLDSLFAYKDVCVYARGQQLLTLAENSLKNHADAQTRIVHVHAHTAHL